MVCSSDKHGFKKRKQLVLITYIDKLKIKEEEILMEMRWLRRRRRS